MKYIDEYAIINKTALLKRIEKLEFQREVEPDNYTQSYLDGKIKQLKEVLSQSISFISEIEKAYDAGKVDEKLSKMFDNPKGRYLGSLKLDI